MSMPEDKLNSLIAAVKSSPDVSQIRFVREHGNKLAEVPVNGALCVVSVKSLGRLDRYVGGVAPSGGAAAAYIAECELLLYANQNSGGSYLYGLAVSLADALRNADNEGSVGKMKIGAQESASYSASIMRRVSFEAVFEEDDV